MHEDRAPDVWVTWANGHRNRYVFRIKDELRLVKSAVKGKEVGRAVIPPAPYAIRGPTAKPPPIQGKNASPGAAASSSAAPVAAPATATSSHLPSGSSAFALQSVAGVPTPGDLVERGPGWRWGDQDGGEMVISLQFPSENPILIVDKLHEHGYE